MGRPYILNLTQEEKISLQQLANELGFSLNELVNHALYEALQADATGVYGGEE